MGWSRIYRPSERLGATVEDMRALWWGYCGAAVIEELDAYPQMWVLGIPAADGA